MSATLLDPDTRPRSTRPTGTSFAGLVGVELRRLWWRRLTKAALVAIVVFSGFTVYNAYQQSTPETLAQAVDNYAQMSRDLEAQRADLPQMIAECKKSEAAERLNQPDANFGCDSMAQGMQMPTLEQMGVVPPVAEGVTATLAKISVYLYAFLAFMLGASLIGAEFSTGAFGTWLTFQPRRVRVAASKLLSAVGGGVLLSALGLGLTWLGAWMIAQINRPDSTLKLPPAAALDESLPHLLLRCVAIVVLAAVAGAALALVVRHTAAVVGFLLGYAVIGELILGSAFQQGRLQPWLFSTNIRAFIDRGTTYYAESCTGTSCQYTEHTLSYTHGWVYLLVAGLITVVVSLLVFRRRDVN